MWSKCWQTIIIYDGSSRVATLNAKPIMSQTATLQMKYKHRLLFFSMKERKKEYRKFYTTTKSTVQHVAHLLPETKALINHISIQMCGVQRCVVAKLTEL